MILDIVARKTAKFIFMHEIESHSSVSIWIIEWSSGCRHGVYQNPSLDVVELENQSTVYVGVDGNLAGVLYFEDKIREDARQVVESLSKQGISVYMLSGDRKSTAEHVASVVGIDKNKVRTPLTSCIQCLFHEDFSIRAILDNARKSLLSDSYNDFINDSGMESGVLSKN